jgi:hypothetical protein
MEVFTSFIDLVVAMLGLFGITQVVNLKKSNQISHVVAQEKQVVSRFWMVETHVLGAK